MPKEWSYDDFRHTTLWELPAEPGIWELFWDTPNYFPAADEAERGVIAERLLRELHDEGWARFVRRPWNRHEWSAETENELTDEEVSATIASLSWRVYPFGDDANVWLVPTEKALAWKDAEAREAFGDKPTQDQSDE